MYLHLNFRSVWKQYFDCLESCLRMRKGKIIGSIALGADVTELKKIEEQESSALQGFGDILG